jgi:hypothetical protein
LVTSTESGDCRDKVWYGAAPVVAKDKLSVKINRMLIIFTTILPKLSQEKRINTSSSTSLSSRLLSLCMPSPLPLNITVFWVSLALWALSLSHPPSLSL